MRTNYVRFIEAIEIALLANGGNTFDKRNCECDPEMGAVPCRYCAIHRALTMARMVAVEMRQTAGKN